MNTTIYLFGKFNSGYTQYPDDYTSGIFRTFSEHAKAATQIAIHRDGNLMYYGYIRKLWDNNYIGICAVLNGLLLTDTDKLFNQFEKIVFQLAEQKCLIHFNEHYGIAAHVDELGESKEADGIIKANFDYLEDCKTVLPPVSYGTAKGTIKTFNYDANLAEIIKSSHTNGYTFIYKSSGFNPNEMDEYIQKAKLIDKLRKEVERARNECLQLNKEKADLQRIIEKQRYENINIQNERNDLQRRFEQLEIENTRNRNERNDLEHKIELQGSGKNTKGGKCAMILLGTFIWIMLSLVGC